MRRCYAESLKEILIYIVIGARGQCASHFVSSRMLLVVDFQAVHCYGIDAMLLIQYSPLLRLAFITTKSTLYRIAADAAAIFPAL